MKIGNRDIGINHLPYYIADIGANHDGNLETAFKLIELAKESGADAAKFQNFKASKIVSRYGFDNLGTKLSHQSNWRKSVYEIYEDASISTDWTHLLKEKCDEFDIEYFTSPYDFESVNHVDDFVKVYKIGSGDITWIDIIEFIAKKSKPILLATGASDFKDVERAYKAIEKYNKEICLMQCNTNYTTDKDKYKFVNLNVLKLYKEKFPNAILGLSDHTIGCSTVCGSIALGARVIEKHFTDDNNKIGPDHKFAMNPKSWKQMVSQGNEIFYSLGNGIKIVEPNEIDSKVVQQRSLRINKNLEKGDILKKEDVSVLRPLTSNGIEPYNLDKVLGKTFTTPIFSDEQITYKHFN